MTPHLKANEIEISSPEREFELDSKILMTSAHAENKIICLCRRANRDASSCFDVEIFHTQVQNLRRRGLEYKVGKFPVYFLQKTL